MLDIFGVAMILLAIYALASTSGIFSERAGIINLSIEGGMTMGALGYAIVVYKLTNQGVDDLQWWMALIGIGSAAMFGLFTTMLLSFTAINLRGNQVVIGMAINIMVPIISLIVIVLLTVGNYSLPMTNLQVTTAIVTDLKPWMIQLLISSIVIIVMIILWIIMRETRFGLRLRAAGENPYALKAAGVSVVTVRHMAMVVAGILAGIAGGIAVSSYAKFSSFTNTTLGMGFIAISILILGQWRIHWTILGSIFFAAIFTAVDHFSVELIEHKFLLAIIPYAATIIVLPILSIFGSNAPKYTGVTYHQ